MKKYEAIIIGGGGGLKLRPIANLGHKIAIIERESLGGTCLNRGCIPSKMLIHAADLLFELKEYEKHDIKLSGEAELNFEKLIKRVNESVTKTSNQIAEAYKNNENIDFYNGEASFVSDKTLTVGGEEITAEKIFIATGSRPRIPNIKGLAGTPFLTSTEALKLEKLPKKMIVIGGGYIGLELGYFYSACGTEVEFVVRDKILAREDEDVVSEFMKVAEKYATFHIGYEPTEVEYKNGIFELKVKNKEGRETIINAEQMLVATGITPNVEALKLENTKIELNEKGFIKTDDYLRTTAENVYALGDVAGRHFFRHSVNFEGEYLLKNLYESRKSPEKINYPAIPSAVFSNPQIARVGLSEKEAKAQNIEYVLGNSLYKNSAMGGDALMSEIGFCKLLFETKSRKLIGAHIVGKESSNMIHTCIAFINMNATADDMLNTVYIHPALPEIVRNSVRNAISLFQ